MKLIFIRHGDPDYEHNTVTEKGKRESQLLANRVCNWNVTDFYVSPYGRAKDTIQPALDKMNRTAEVKEWLREFDVRVKNPYEGKEKSCAWDLMPTDFFNEENFFSREKWLNTKIMKSGKIRERYQEVCSGFDELMASAYDYVRLSPKEAVYNCFPHLTQEEAAVDTHLVADQKKLDDRNIVFVCHLGVMFAIISHLTGISPIMLWQGFFVAPTSVTILGAEERKPGEVVFRVQSLGDTRHLYEGNEIISASGFYGNVCHF